MAKEKDTPVCRASDVGFGFTKMTASNFKPDGTVEVATIPSFAGPQIETVAGRGITSSNIFTVRVGGEMFSVGPDARRSATSMGRQILESSFFRSSQYAALVKASIALMKVPEKGIIDKLVVGLPLNTYNDPELVQHVENLYLGLHAVPVLDGQDNDQERDVVVKRVDVVPQVLGSLVHLAETSDEAKDVENSQNLTIDVGYGTLLWLTTEGFSLLSGRSNGNMGGASSLLQSVLKAIDPRETTNIKLLERLDDALRNQKQTIMVNGEDVEIEKYREILESAAKENLTEMLRSVGTFADIDNIFLTGGGAHLYYGLLKQHEKLQKRTIIYNPKNARYQNVWGFQALAETSPE